MAYAEHNDKLSAQVLVATGINPTEFNHNSLQDWLMVNSFLVENDHSVFSVVRAIFGFKYDTHPYDLKLRLIEFKKRHYMVNHDYTDYQLYLAKSLALSHYSIEDITNSLINMDISINEEHYNEDDLRTIGVLKRNQLQSFNDLAIEAVHVYSYGNDHVHNYFKVLDNK